MLPSRNLLMLAGLGALLATVVLFAGVMTRPIGADAAPTTATETITTEPSTTEPSTTESAAPETVTPFPTDALGFVDSKARCDEAQNAAVFARTQRSLVVICANPNRGFEYRGVRISDGAALQATATQTDAGFEASTDGAVYTVTPTELVVTSAGKVIYKDTWIDYLQAR
ncbi:MAG: hypothetical protein ABWY93_02655 [Mycobacterium sp.]